MDYLIFAASLVIIVAEVCMLFFLPKNMNEGIHVFVQGRNLQNLRKIILINEAIFYLVFVVFLFFSIIAYAIWDMLQQNMVQKLSLYSIIFCTFLFFLLGLKIYLIKRKAILLLEGFHKNQIFDAIVENEKNGVWVCKFFMSDGAHLGYVEEKPSAEKIQVIALKYKKWKKMFLLQEIH